MNPKTPKNSKALINRKRTLSRLMAIQVFYQFEFYNEEQTVEDLMNNLIDHYVIEQDDSIKSFRKKIDLSLLETLLSGIQLNLAQIDHEISALLQNNWDLDTIPDTMLYILRFGSFELRYMKDVPLKVVIDEYVDIGASFFEDKKVTFLNGILENLAIHYREEEFAKDGKVRPKKIEITPIVEEKKITKLDPKIKRAITKLKKSIKNA